MRTYLLMLMCACTLVAHGQYYYKGKDGKPINIYDVINAYKAGEIPKQLRTKENDKAHERQVMKGKNIDESGEYQFDRWLWYWKQHTDIDGNIISPIKTWDEWAAYKERNNLKNARITGINSSNWKFQGPDTPSGDGSGLGRISAISFHPTDANTYWVGSDGGGAWKTTDNGVTWTAMTDNMPSLVVSDVDINPRNPNTVYICTGDRDHGGWDNHLDAGVGYGIGILKTYNGGATWDTTGMKWNASEMKIANCLVINPIDTNCVLVATTTGVYKSMDGGMSWTQTAAGHFRQLLYNPADTNVILASKFYDASTSGSAQILRSTDGGNTWTQVTSFSKVLMVSFAVSPADPKVVKVITSSADAVSLFGLEGVYSSTDSGHTFTQVYAATCSNNLLDWSSGTTHSCGGQGQYDLMIAIDPTNVNKLYLGGINSWYSNNGGSTWTILSQWNSYASGMFTTVPVVHADKHVAAFHPLVPTRFFEGNDGGIFYTDGAFSSSSTWNDITTGLGITEFYSNALSNSSQAVLGGAQDNNCMIIINRSMGVLTGGDGMQCQVDPVDSNTVYTSSQYGNIYRIDNLYTGGAFADNISNNIPGSTTGAWLTPYVLEPSCNFCIIAGYDQVWQSLDYGSSWFSISPVFYPGRNIRNIGVTAADTYTVYAVPEDTNIVHVTFNMGGSWSKINGGTGRISFIEVDPKDKTHFWVTYGGYGVNKVAEYKPISGWKYLNNNLPDVPVNCIRIDTSTRILYIGTDVGVFYKTDTGTNWQLYNNGLPIVRISQLNINYTTGDLWAATYGRGMWSSPKAIGVPKGVNKITTQETTSIVPNPNTGNFNFITSTYYANKRVDMRLMDNIGRTVWSNASRFDASGKVNVNTDGLAKGVYFFEAATDNAVIANKKVILQ